MTKFLGFSMRLKELMKEHGVNNYTLSLKLGSQDQTIANWLLGVYFPRHNMLVKLADYFDCSIDYLLGLSDDYTYFPCVQKTTFCDRFMLCLEQLNITSYRVVADCHLSNPSAVQWLKHNKMPETASLISLAKYFKCTVDFLLGRAVV